MENVLIPNIAFFYILFINVTALLEMMIWYDLLSYFEQFFSETRNESLDVPTDFSWKKIL